MAAKKEKTYKESVDRLEEILSKLENDDMQIDEIATSVKEAAELLKNCKSILLETNKAVEAALKELDD